jgi:Lar family restriction alleviation protein
MNTGRPKLRLVGRTEQFFKDAPGFTDGDAYLIVGTELPKPCPFCGGGPDNVIIDTMGEERGTLTYHGRCLECGCQSPSAMTQFEAAQAWNSRTMPS